MKKLLLILICFPIIGFGQAITSEEIVTQPTRSINSIVSTITAIYQMDEGDAINIRGSRADATSYIIDGIKVRGYLEVPFSAIKQITVITGSGYSMIQKNINGIKEINNFIE
tara:strand:- start:100 stop:435 length:336 start_codon:yes stop_codon:yes gene_type:complete